MAKSNQSMVEFEALKCQQHPDLKKDLAKAIASRGKTYRLTNSRSHGRELESRKSVSVHCLANYLAERLRCFDSSAVKFAHKSSRVRQGCVRPTGSSRRRDQSQSQRR